MEILRVSDVAINTAHIIMIEPSEALPLCTIIHLSHDANRLINMTYPDLLKLLETNNEKVKEHT